MKKLAIITIIGLSLLGNVAPVFAEEQPTSVIDNTLATKIDAYIEERKDYTASVSVAVVNGQETTIEKYYGYENIENAKSASENTVYEWGSASKLLIWTSIMQLKEAGKLDLNEDIKTYLPENFLTKLKYADKITLTHLMNHTAGFQELVYGAAETTNKTEILSLEAALKITQPAQIYQPDKVCSYSNWGAALAAYIVEQVSGKEFYQYVNENIFKPLNMQQTSVKTDRSDNPWVEKQRENLKAYSIYEGGYEKLGTGLIYIQLYPAGAAAGTLTDFTRFLKALLPDENQQSPLFEKAETLTEFHTASLNFTDSDIPRIHHGMWSLPYGNGVIGHSGNTQACTSSLFFDPTTKVGMVVMTNEIYETSYNYGLLEVIFGEYSKKATNDLRPTDVSGIYTSPRINIAHGVYKINKFLSFSWWNQTSPTTYEFAGMLKRTQIADNLFLTDDGNGTKYLSAIKLLPNGKTAIESYTQDDQKISTFSFVAHTILLLIFLLAIIYHLLSLIIKGLKWLYLTLRKKTVQKNELRRLYLITSFAVLVIAALVYSIILIPGDIYYVQTAIKCSIIILATLTLLITSYLRLKKAKNLPLKLSGKVWLILNLFVIANVLYWEWFNFWSF
ncbi:CubicO group peptidase (beta-lactamase class C family) [Enterococcus sp. PF1-24]|uniref:serine hydrolase domain-containing protein n=1 Tax=unclassified Enterococcus TaxID=2608891 RepID=UPI002475B15B|nr:MULTISPECIES: serine hydrolase domain-containing protein [unclassified Enterococcus]MDH6365328.1 CubicO group peptidase (beta-lactamase class C family) [Enterococcus sp. PFB1-1]MDH6402416.1 CubicO group peptidase (beta-lactamase class C family) [Enterococcus sp. PF1-24]